MRQLPMSFSPWREALAKWPADWLEEWEERAAIMEHMGKLPKAEAEWQAFLIVQERMTPSLLVKG